jgi:hypothetical protein
MPICSRQTEIMSDNGSTSNTIGLEWLSRTFILSYFSRLLAIRTRGASPLFCSSSVRKQEYDPLMSAARSKQLIFCNTSSTIWKLKWWTGLRCVAVGEILYRYLFHSRTIQKWWCDKACVRDISLHAMYPAQAETQKQCMSWKCHVLLWETPSAGRLDIIQERAKRKLQVLLNSIYWDCNISGAQSWRCNH